MYFVRWSEIQDSIIRSFFFLLNFMLLYKLELVYNVVIRSVFVTNYKTWLFYMVGLDFEIDESSILSS